MPRMPLRLHKTYNYYCKVQMLQKKNAYLLLILPVALLALLMDWQYDEAWSYFEVQKNTISDIVSYASYKYANNHVINSLYFKMVQFGDFQSPFAYRLLSLLGFGIFVFANYKLLDLFNLNKWFILPICIAPYFVFFAMGRGYALSLGAFSLALHLVLNNIKKHQTKHYVFASLLLILAAVSNFSFVFISNAVFLVILFYLYQHKKYNAILSNALVYGVGLVYVIAMGQQVSKFDPYIIGSNSLFANGSIQSLLGEFSYSKLFLEWGITKLPMILIAIAFAVLMVLVFLDLLKNKQEIFIRIIVGTILLAFIQLIISHLVLNTLFPTKRATIFLQYGILLLALLVTKTSYNKLFTFIPIGVLFLFSLIHVSWLYLDLKNPSLSEIISTTKNHSLYHVGYNPSLILENEIQGNKTTLFQYYEIYESLTAMRQDSTSSFYLFLPRTSSKSVPLKKEFVLNARKHYALYKITP